MKPTDDLPTSPAAERNKAPLLDVLQALLPPRATVLEVASGTGQHAAHFAAAQPQWRWQPSDGAAAALPTIAARCAPLPNVAAPLHLDLLALRGGALPDALFDAVFVANVLHIAPWPACAALMRLAAGCLRAGGVLVVYGPFEVEGEPLAPSNRAFDAELRARDARWGLRRLGDVQGEATRAGLAFAQRFAMPANNLTLVWRRSGSLPAPLGDAILDPKTGRGMLLDWPDYPMLKRRVVAALSWCVIGIGAALVATWMVAGNLWPQVAPSVLIAGVLVSAVAASTVALARYRIRELLPPT